MKSERISVEWIFGKVMFIFTHIDFKMILQPNLSKRPLL